MTFCHNCGAWQGFEGWKELLSWFGQYKCLLCKRCPEYVTNATLTEEKK